MKTNIYAWSFLIQQWQSDGYFVRVTLKNLGLRIQLGHPPREACNLPIWAKGDSFLIIDTHGIHEVGLDFCSCERSTNILSQLLRYKLYPATTYNPQTAATFRVLDHFHILRFESKCSELPPMNSIKASHVRQIMLVFYMSESVISLQSLVLL